MASEKFYNWTELRSRIQDDAYFGIVNQNDSVKILFQFREPNPAMTEPNIMGLIDGVPKSDCSCSDPVVTKDGIEVVFTHNKPHKDTYKEDFPNGYIPYSNSLTIKFNDGKPMFKIDETTGRQIDNPDKTTMRLNLWGFLTWK
jgi:hypothetical protein